MAATPHRRRLFLIGIYAVLPTALIVLMLLGWMISAEKATVVLQAVNSPGGRYRAEVVREDPGVSSTYEYMVRVMPSGLTTLRKSLHVLPFAPVYIALSVHHEPDKLVVVWSGPNQVTIDCEGCGTIKPGKEEWREIALRYELR
jgi:hypothetical protein